MRLSLFAIFLAVTAAGAGAERALNPTFESGAPLSAQSPIDARVFDRLKRLDIQPANLSSDAVFLRRAYLDVIGTLPTAQEAAQFLADRDPAKRPALIARPPEPANFPDGTPARLAPGRDPREVFADWLIAPKNPWFARNAVNRVWSWLLGRGIIHEPDDIRPDNPPSNPELLTSLVQEFVAARYDLKSIYRLILNSQTYQLSSIPRTERAEGAANFAYYPLRRIDAEVLALSLIHI